MGFVMTQVSLFRRLLLPGFVFQSVVIAGGYGTGRELAEFFLSEGPLGGLLAMAVSTLLWSLVCVVTFEFARVFQTFDYRSFFKELLGRGWWIYEAAYLVFMLIILAVIAAAAGSLLEETFGLPYWAGVLGIMAAVGILVLGGSRTIEKAMAGWSLVLYAAYIVLFLWCFQRFGGDIRASFASVDVGRGWGMAGVRYAAYNVALIPPLLFAVRHSQGRRDSVVAGLLTGPIAMIPGLLFFLSMAGEYPAVLDRPVPANHLLELLGSRSFQIAFQIVLFGTLIETGTGLIHGMNERISRVYEERGRSMPALLRSGLGVGLLLSGTLLASVGLVDLIARGYGTLTYVFLAVYVVPILTLGVFRLFRPPPGSVGAEE
ncbi:hypothetical protein ACFL3S_09865 [Gemmatimonadota bacterium]